MTDAAKKNEAALHCEVCDIQVNSAAMMRTHLQGQRHAQNVAGRDKGEDTIDLHCDVCNIDVTSAVAMDEHCKGRKHAQVIKQQIVARPRPGVLPRSSLSVPRQPPKFPFACKFCEFSSSTKPLLLLHNLAEHTVVDNVVAPPGDDDLYCEVCEVSVTSDTCMEQHLQGRRHLEEEQRKREQQRRRQEQDWQQNRPRPRWQTWDENYEHDPLYCEICDVRTYNIDSMRAHKDGRRHNENVGERMTQRANKLYCSVCSVRVTSETMMDQHIKGRRHQDAVAKQSNAEKEEEEETFDHLHCDICDINVTSKPMMDQHKEGRKHKDAVAASGQEKEEEGELGIRCMVCDILLTSEVVMLQHLAGSKHCNTERVQRGSYLGGRYIFHYTNRRSYESILEEWNIRSYQRPASHARMGRGVYFTSLPPTCSASDIIQMNYFGGGHVSSVEYYIGVWMDDITWEKAADREVFVVKGSQGVDLKNVQHFMGKC